MQLVDPRFWYLKRDMPTDDLLSQGAIRTVFVLAYLLLNQKKVYIPVGMLDYA